MPTFDDQLRPCLHRSRNRSRHALILALMIWVGFVDLQRRRPPIEIGPQMSAFGHQLSILEPLDLWRRVAFDIAFESDTSSFSGSRVCQWTGDDRSLADSDLRWRASTRVTADAGWR